MIECSKSVKRMVGMLLSFLGNEKERSWSNCRSWRGGGEEVPSPWLLGGAAPPPDAPPDIRCF